LAWLAGPSPWQGEGLPPALGLVQTSAALHRQARRRIKNATGERRAATQLQRKR